jgi:hypothetical protein
VVSRRFLEAAAGYVVYGSDGGRVGKVVEFVTGERRHGDSLAIRCEGFLLSKRRTVPAAAVASVNPDERTVTLLLDATSIERAHELHADEIRQGWVADRIAHYADAPTPKTEAIALDTEAGGDGHTPVSTMAEDLASAGEPVKDTDPVRHVLFAPTGTGYVLIERDGAAPARTATVELSDPPGRFAVVKLARSPLPHDRRLCAYLDKLE